MLKKKKKKDTQYLSYILVHVGFRGQDLCALGKKCSHYYYFYCVINNKEDCYRNESQEAPAMLTCVKSFVISASTSMPCVKKKQTFLYLAKHNSISLILACLIVFVKI